MITINKNSDNICVFTLNEKTTIPSANYFLQLVSNQNTNDKNLLLAISADTTSNVLRYNKFVIQEVPLAQENLLNRKINLEEATYDYYVWESPSGNTQFSAVTSIVESGLLTVNGIQSTGTTIYNQTNTVITFE